MSGEPKPDDRRPDRFWLFDVVVPLLTTVLAGALFLVESNASGVARALAMLAFGLMLAVYFLVRALRTHATLSRLAAVGEADELVREADRQLRGALGPGRFVGRNPAPFYVYKATGQWLRGDDAEAEATLAQVETAPAAGGGAAALSRRSRLSRTWQLMHDTLRFRILCLRGDAAAARALWDGRLAAQLGGIGAVVDLERREAEALLAWAEGDDAACIERAKKLANDVRIAVAPRALYHFLAGSALHRSGDHAAAMQHLAEAVTLAPQTFIGERARALQAGAA
jgi:hypothetical protein